MNFQELQEEATNQTHAVEVFEGGYEERNEQTDMQDAIVLLNKSRTFLSLLADMDLCKSLTKRERAVADGLADMLKEFLDEMDSVYGD